MSQLQNKTTPTINVCMITYNHEKYISEAIEGVLMQKTTFPIQLVVGEDYSTDNTRAICEEYQKKYPNIIKLLPKQKNNLGMMPNFIRTLVACKSNYIALCEGDDYWTDPTKLQKQVDLIESKLNASLVFSDRTVLNSNDNKSTPNTYKDRRYNLNDVIAGFIPPTQTMLFRNNNNLSSFLKKHQQHPSGDQLIALFYAMQGFIYCLKDQTAIYRITGEGAWSSRKDNHDYSIQLYLNFKNEILLRENITSHFYFHIGLGRKILTAYGLNRCLIDCKVVKKTTMIYSIGVFYIYRILNKIRIY